MEYTNTNHHGTNSQPELPDDVLLLPSQVTSFLESAEQIFSKIADSKEMFIYGGTIVILKSENGQKTIEQLTPHSFITQLEKYGRTVAYSQAYSGRFIKDKRCTPDMARTLMFSHVAKEILPEIQAIVNCPILTENSEILDLGYHSFHKILVTEGRVENHIPVGVAVKALKELLYDFDFTTESDESRALSMFILPMLKMSGLIGTRTPVDVALANESQSGKTYRQQVVAAIYNCSPAVVTQRNKGVGGIDESIGAAIASGIPFVQLDNFRNNFNSPSLEAYISQPEQVRIRLPKRMEMTVNASSVSFQISSNGVNLTEDMANRSCFIRIRKQMKKQWKAWPEGDLLSHVKANQPYYIGCVVSVAKHWLEQGKPRTNILDHDMREWAQVMDWIVQEVFKTAPLLDNHKDIQKQSAESDLSWLREVCIQVEKDGKIGDELSATDIFELCELTNIAYPNNKPYNNEQAAIKYIGIIMKRLFADDSTIEVDSTHIIERVSKGEKSWPASGPKHVYVVSLSVPF